MKLAELNHMVVAVRRRLRAEHRRVRRAVLEEAAVTSPGRSTVADLERLLRRQGTLRAARARTLAAHPDVVDLLAQRHVLRLHVRAVQALLCAVRATVPAPPPRFDAARLNSDFWVRVQQVRRARRAHCGGPARRTVPVRRRAAVDVACLQQRADALQAELGRVEHALGRAMWEIDVVPVPGALP